MSVINFVIIGLITFSAGGTLIYLQWSLKKIDNFFNFRRILLDEISNEARRQISAGNFANWESLYDELNACDSPRLSSVFYKDVNLPKPFRGSKLDKLGLVDAAYARYIMNDIPPAPF